MGKWMNKNRVSIIIPVYNRTFLLRKTVAAVFNQLYKNWELIIVDDGSEENVAESLQSFAGDQIRIIHQPNRGNSTARNTGFSHSNGDFVCYLDSDDLWDSRFLEACVNTLDSHPEAGVVFTSWHGVNQEDDPLPVPLLSPPFPENLEQALVLGFPILPSSAMVRKEIITETGGFDPALDDWDLWLRMIRRGVRFIHLPQDLLAYRIYGMNLNRKHVIRHTVHQRTLDKYFNNINIPASILKIKNIAYANQYRQFSLLAFQAGDTETGLAHFAQAISLNPALTTDVDLFYSITCSAWKNWKNNRLSLDELISGTKLLELCLSQLRKMAKEGRITKLIYHRACSLAYIEAAKAFYNHSGSQWIVLFFLFKAVIENPLVFFSVSWQKLLIRGLIGIQVIKKSRGIIKRLSGHIPLTAWKPALRKPE